jgi:hypothetical protein
LCVLLKETFAWHKVGKIPIAIEQIEYHVKVAHGVYTVSIRIAFSIRDNR